MPHTNQLNTGNGFFDAWQSSWELTDPFGTSTELIPPNLATSTYYDDSNNLYCVNTIASAKPCPILWAVAATAGHPAGGADQAGTPLAQTALELAVESGTLSASDYRLVYNQGARIYANPTALPRAFVATQVEPGVSDDQALAQLAEPTFAPTSTLLLAETPPAAEWSPATPPQRLALPRPPPSA